MTRALFWPIVVLAVLAGLSLVPVFGSSFHLAVAISVLNFLVLATAWALFSGATRYISLATAAFFGLGAYTVAELGPKLPWLMVLATAVALAMAVALVVGLSTLRLSGIYFVIFTFGLAELIRQLATWYQVNVTRSVGRYIFLDIPPELIFWQLFALAVLVFLAGWCIARSRLGLAVRMIGDDEAAALHCGIDATRIKLLLFALSAAFMAAVGAVMAPRWTYIDPTIAFNPLVSFQVVIMALLGGARSLYGPLLGAVPLVLLFDVISANFPNSFSIVLGLVFIVIVYFVPQGVIGFLERFLPAQPEPAAIPATPVNAAERRPRPPSGAEAAVLRLEGLTKAFGGRVAVNSLSATFPRGSIVGLIGPNGSGKTTVINLISGATRADAGTIQLNGRDITNVAPHRIARLGVGRTFQLVRVFETTTCLENVLASVAWRGIPRWGDEARAEALAYLARVRPDRAGIHARRRAHLSRPETAGAGQGVGATARSSPPR